MNTNPQFPEHEHLNCPRCNSNNTKFCYFNNYNLTQPRHYCKNCRRYWTKGGTLRKIPIGGTTRKPTKRSISNKRPVDCSPISSIPPVQLNPKGPELAPAIFDLNRNDFVFNSWRSNSSNYRDLGANLIDGCVKEELKKTEEIDVFQMKCLGGKNDRKGESSGGGDGGGNRWPYFSVFVSGSVFVTRT